MEKFLENLAEILETETILTPDTKLDELIEWDSLGLVSFAAMVDAEYGKALVFDDLKSAETVHDLYLLVI